MPRGAPRRAAYGAATQAHPLPLKDHIVNKALLLLGAAAALAAGAGTHATADSGFHDRPASPRSLPANNLPPFGMLDDDGTLVPEPACRRHRASRTAANCSRAGSAAMRACRETRYPR